MLCCCNQKPLTMRNKVEIRAFAVEQVVKMRCMSETTIEDVVEQAKLIESYIVGESNIPEYVNETSEMMNIFADMKDALKSQLEKECHLPTYEEVMDKLKDDTQGYNLMGCGLKPNEA